MPYIRLIDGQPEWVTKNDIRLENPDTSFPVHMGPNEMAAWGCIPVRILNEPDTSDTEIAVLDDTATLHDDEWVQGWTVRSKTVGELLALVPWKNSEAAEEALVAWIDDLTKQIKKKYPEIVREEWRKEEANARAYLANEATQEQLDAVTADALAANRSIEDHVAKVVKKADELREISGLTRPLWLQTRTALRAANSPLEYPAIFEAAVANVTPIAILHGLEVQA